MRDMAQWLLDLDSSTLNIIIAGAVLLLIGAASVSFLLTRGEREMKDRIGRIAQRPRQGARDRKSVSPALSLRKTDNSLVQLDKIVNQILPNPVKMRKRLTRTGRKISLGVYVLFSLLIVGIGMLIARNVVGLNFGPALLIGLFLGLLVPHMVIGSMIGRRKKRFLAIFPDALDVLIRGLKAGLPVSESIRIVGQEMTGPVAEEFLMISDNIRIGGEFDEVLWSAADRIDVPEFNFF